MHEKYFVSLATEIYQIPDKWVRQHVARAVARACMRVNPRFNMQLFLTACDAVWPSAPKAMTDCCEKNCEALESHASMPKRTEQENKA